MIWIATVLREADLLGSNARPNPCLHGYAKASQNSKLRSKDPVTSAPQFEERCWTWIIPWQFTITRFGWSLIQSWLDNWSWSVESRSRAEALYPVKIFLTQPRGHDSRQGCPCNCNLKIALRRIWSVDYGVFASCAHEIKCFFLKGMSIEGKLLY